MNDTVWSGMVAGKWSPIYLSILMGVFLLAGCHETTTFGLGIVLDKDAFESLRLGSTTRADVLLLWGPPNYRLDDDRFLIYKLAATCSPETVDGNCKAYLLKENTLNYLCLEFGPDSRLMRIEQLTASHPSNPGEATRRCSKQPDEWHESNKK